MKCLIILFITASSAFGATVSGIDGLISTWKMNDVAGQTVVADAIEVNEGTAAANIVSTTGKINQAITFDGAADSVDLGTDDSLNLNAVVTTYTFAIRSVSGDMSSHQGVADNGTNLFTIDTTTIYKRNRTSPYGSVASETLADIITAAGGDLDATDHFGDGCAYGNYVYVPVEQFANCGAFSDMHIVRLNKADLTYSAHWDITAQSHEIASICTDGTYLYIVSYCDGSKIWVYDITDGSYVAGNLITLSSTIDDIQGITMNLARDTFYISDSDTDSMTQVATDGTVGSVVYQNSLGVFEGIEYTQGQMMAIIDIGPEYIYFLTTDEQLSGFSIAAWIKPDGVADEQAIVSRYEYDANKRQYYLRLDGGDIDFVAGKLNGTSANVASTAATDGVWQFVVGVVDNTNALIYLYKDDAAAETTVHANDSTVTFTQSTGIGRLMDTPVEAFFKGDIDNVMIFNKALSAAEVATLYNGGAGVEYSGVSGGIINQYIMRMIIGQ